MSYQPSPERCSPPTIETINDDLLSSVASKSPRAVSAKKKTEEIDLTHSPQTKRAPRKLPPRQITPPESDNKAKAQVVQTTKSKGMATVQLFVQKAFNMINECDPSIASWNEKGDKFIIKDKEIFAATIIPQYYDHSNYSSFTRQLNFYGFTREQSTTLKVIDVDSPGTGQETFCHPHFQRDDPKLLEKLQRKSIAEANKNVKKRRSPITASDVVFLQARVETMEQTCQEVMGAMQQMSDQTFAAAAAIQNLQQQSAAKDEKISALEDRIFWLEQCRVSSASAATTNGCATDDSFVATKRQRLNHSHLLPQGNDTGMDGQGSLMASTFGGPSSLLPLHNNHHHHQQHNNNNSNPTLPMHPKMKSLMAGRCPSPPRDLFSYMNASLNISYPLPGNPPAREPSLDLGILSQLARGDDDNNSNGHQDGPLLP